MVAGDAISMPDKWEYPWFAAWDLAFHCAPLSLVDVDFAKQQIELLLSTRYLHANGQIPAYEWNFSDVNPPVTTWAALYVYQREADVARAHHRVDRAPEGLGADSVAGHRAMYLELAYIGSGGFLIGVRTRVL